MIPPARTPRSHPSQRLTPYQWRSGIRRLAGLAVRRHELHLYTLVATPFVIQCSPRAPADPAGEAEDRLHPGRVSRRLGGRRGVSYGRLGDVLGAAAPLALSVLTYAVCTGLCAARNPGVAA